MPIVMDNDYDAIRAGIVAAYGTDYNEPRIIRIKNTMRMDEMLISAALLGEARRLENVEVDDKPITLQFDIHGNLVDLSRFLGE